MSTLSPLTTILTPTLLFTLYAQNALQPEDKDNLYWQPAVKIDYAHFLSNSDVDCIKCNEKYGLKMSANIQLKAIMDIPKSHLSKKIKKQTGNDKVYVTWSSIYHEVLIQKKENAYSEWRTLIDELLASHQDYSTQPDDTKRLILVEPIKQDAYLTYKKWAMGFIHERNKRIANYVPGRNQVQLKILWKCTTQLGKIDLYSTIQTNWQLEIITGKAKHYIVMNRL